MTIRELIRRLKVQCQDNLDMDVEFEKDGNTLDGYALEVFDIYYEGRLPKVVINLQKEGQ